MNPKPTVARTRAQLADAVAGPQRRAVVMTMGALHEGHVALVRRARQLGEQVIVTIFVNPLQFGAGEDLDAYPRDLEGDLATLEPLGVEVVFAPSAAELYPSGSPAVTVDPGPLGRVWEGAIRPGHFAGVLTVVHKLACLTRADVALFGQKDAQQLALVRQMTADLDLPVAIEAVPIRRASSGIALSSRNAYLSAAELADAHALSRAIGAAEAAARQARGAKETFAAATEVLAGARGVSLDYLALVAAEDLVPIASDLVRIGEELPVGAVPTGSHETDDALLLVAARVGGTRLIDNAPLRLR